MMVPPEPYGDCHKTVIEVPKPQFDVSVMLVEAIYKGQICFKIQQFPALYMLADCYTRHPNRNLVTYLADKFMEMATCKNMHLPYESAMEIDSCYPALNIVQSTLASMLRQLLNDHPIVHCGDLLFWDCVFQELHKNSSEEETNDTINYLSSSGITISIVRGFVSKIRNTPLSQHKVLAGPDSLSTIVGRSYYSQSHTTSEPSTLLCYAIDAVSKAHSISVLNILNSIECRDQLLVNLCKLASLSDIQFLRARIDPAFWSHLSNILLDHSWRRGTAQEEEVTRLTGTIDKCNRIFKKCKMAVLYHFRLSDDCDPKFLGGDYIMRGWFNDGPVYMMRKRLEVQDRLRGNISALSRIVLFRFECRGNKRELVEQFPPWYHPVGGDGTSKKRTRSYDVVISREQKQYCWTIATVDNDCEDPSSCKCLLRSLQRLTTDGVTGPSTEYSVFFYAISNNSVHPPKLPRHWRPVEGTIPPKIDSVCIPAIPGEFHKFDCAHATQSLNPV
jgi:hypothetical protein